ncbi:MAG TPA: hypothetical protein DDY59_07970 [Lachnospiraceae bacterium]|nr:hypothetical protein [Lachnospiraceae bacterium]
MGSLKVSVVIPIYNSERFLEECLESLHNQSLVEIEFICVNDGSKDNSLKIINDYIAKDLRFKLLDKPNSGYGISMNMGFDIARGEYVGIVESDDYVEPTMFEELYNLATKYKLDMIKSSYYRFTTNTYGTYDSVYIKNTTNVNRVICPADYPKIVMNTTANWTGLYSSSFIKEHNIRHNETPGASYQDIGFHLLTLSLAERAYFVDKAYYHYRYDNPNSSINNKSKIYCACEEYEYMLRYYDNHPETGKIFEGVLWARFHNTCLNTYARVANQYKKEFLNYYYKTFNLALETGKLKPENFSPQRWKEMIKILMDPEKFHKNYLRYRTRDKIKSEFVNGAPLMFRLIWSIEDNGIKYTKETATDEIKKILGIHHWSRLDEPAMHAKIVLRHMLKKIHMENISRKIKSTKKLCNKYLGERCFIVCTGPSLKMNDLDMISNEYSFGMNTIYLAYNKTSWRPSFYVCIDQYAQKRMSKEYMIDYSTICKGPIIINEKIKVGKHVEQLYKIPIGFDNHTRKYLKSGRVKVEEDLSICAYDCFSVTNFAITAAIYMGFSEIYIIGCDCNYDGKVHFVQSKLDPKSEEKNRWEDAVYLSIRGYEAMKDIAEKHNVKIYNATRGGHLEVFERVKFDQIDFK